MMSRIGLGFDTGGTYTDAVIMDLDTYEILARSKSLTTRNDLSLGIRGAIEGFDRELLDRISTVSLSSTLATNSIVEGKGCRVGLICMGDELSIEAHVDEKITLNGFITPAGKEEEPLDEEGARRFLESVRGKVDCIAVNGFMSVRNPKHELRIKEMAREILGIPTVCGHELSSGLGFNERAITCVMNARLIPIIDELLVSVKKVLDDFQIDSPLMVVKGDGSIMSEAVARERPIETILSGPASSINGANKLAGCKDSVVVDIGGTTTDIGVIRDGKPHLDPEGAIIGGYRTRVMAAEITTAGLGGDSRIILNGKKLYMSALKVMPVCVAAHKYPALVERLQGILERPMVEFKEAKYEKNIMMDTEFFIKLKDPKPGMLNELDSRFVQYISDMPRSLDQAKWALKENPVMFGIARMEELGLIQRVGLTPTDIMHVRGVFTAYNAEASLLAIKIVARKLGWDVDQFVKKIDAMVTEKIASEIIRKVIYEDSGETQLEGFGLDLMDKAINAKEAADFKVNITITKPIVGIGGPTYDMLPKVAERLGTELIIPENYDVGNAVGAIIGKIEETIELIVRPAASTRMSDPACTIFSRLGRVYMESYNAGLQHAEESGRKFVLESVLSMGAEDVEVFVDKKVEGLILADGVLNPAPEITFIIKAVGKPRSRKD
jgi:N-methylhydantoinase A/oxoprolinase/acetone carboxylase beta subunit